MYIYIYIYFVVELPGIWIIRSGWVATVNISKTSQFSLKFNYCFASKDYFTKVINETCIEFISS